ncbi:hypothetical protein [Pollutibacter soli]|uniref:hypothetical protein n=1 Tax=Pollutibacter soli TaxID=3034157 RepID=UPI0030138851
MRMLNILRIILALTILFAAIYYWRLSKGHYDNSTFVISEAANPVIKIVGDYSGRINIDDTAVTVDESILFERDSLAYLIQREIPALLGNDDIYSYDEKISKRTRLNSVETEKYIERYLKELKDLRWNESSEKNAKKYFFKRTSVLPYTMGFAEKTKRLAIPVLFNNVTDLHHRPTGSGYFIVNDSVGKLTYDGNVDYILSDNSKVVLRANEGIVERIFPEARKTSLIDEQYSDVFVFDLHSIGSSLDQTRNGTTTVNVEILNPRYNNQLGRLMRNWSPAQVAIWSIVTFLALFADKVKELFFKPLVNRVFQKKQQPGGGVSY